MKIQGYFRGIKSAHEAAERLRSAGFGNVIVDINDHYEANNNIQTNVPGTENTPNLSSLVMHSGDIDDDAASPLAAANPMVSGMGGFEEITDINYRIIVDAGTNKEQRVKDIINECGGELISPNLDLPERIKGMPRA